MPKQVQYLNGYRLIYKPDHPRHLNDTGHRGYVYEHILRAEEILGRPLREKEVVHHLDGDRSNNLDNNLLVLETGQHAKLHMWLKSTFQKETLEVEGVNSGKPKVDGCPICGRHPKLKDAIYCSVKCQRIGQASTKRPSAEQLAQDIATLSWCAIGRKYGVTDNSARKWARRYGLLPTKAILSQASGTPEEGAETTGEVKPS